VHDRAGVEQQRVGVPCGGSKRAGRLTARFAAAAVSALTLAACSEPPRDVAYYLSHPAERSAQLQSCLQLFNPDNDPKFRAAIEADGQVTAAEHGPPFHGHDVAWYKSHRVQQLQEAGYCDSLHNRTADPDCVAAAHGEGPRF